jgi:hypothetical protein
MKRAPEDASVRNRLTTPGLTAFHPICLGFIALAVLTLACGSGGGMGPLQEVAAPTVIALSDANLKDPVVRPTPPVFGSAPIDPSETALTNTTEAAPQGVPIEPRVASVVAAVPAVQQGAVSTRPQAPSAVQPASARPVAPAPPVQNQAAPLPAWGATASVSKVSVAAGTTQTFVVLVENRKSANAVIDVEVFDRSGKRVHQTALANLFLAAGTHKFNASWAIPKEAPPGTYTVSVGVFEPNWTKLIIWKDALATFNVTPR